MVKWGRLRDEKLAVFPGGVREVARSLEAVLRVRRLRDYSRWVHDSLARVKSCVSLLLLHRCLLLF